MARQGSRGEGKVSGKRMRRGARGQNAGNGRSARVWIAGGVSAALIATIAVIAQGYDARETPREEPGVWVAREAGQYARVNTDTGELDTVRNAEQPSSLVQSGESSALFSHGNGRAWVIDPTNPVNLSDEAEAGDDARDADEQGAGEDEAGGADAAADTVAQDPAAGDAAGDGAEGAGGGGSGSVRMPDGTRDVVSAGSYVVVRTDAGEAYLGELASAPGAEQRGTAADQRLSAAALEERLATLRPLDPFAEGSEGGEGDTEDAEGSGGGSPDEEADEGGEPAAGDGAGGTAYRADAVAVDADGTVALFSSEEGAVRIFDAASGEFTDGGAELDGGGLDDAAGRANADAPAEEAPQIALVAGRWAVLDAPSGTLWREGEAAVELEIVGSARLQASDAGGRAGADGADTGAVLVADSAGLWRTPRDGEAERVVEATGDPAQPIAVAGQRHAAWLGQSGGTLWNEGRSGAGAGAGAGDAETIPLQFDDSVSDPGELLPAFRSNGARAVLSDGRTGMVWTLPEGRLIPLAQWSVSDPPKEDRGTVVVEEVNEQLPPTAVDDAFGVRPGELAPLPVMLNDFDPNKSDVLTIVPESLEEAPLPQSFGAVQLLPDAQSLTVAPRPGVTGTGTFTYRVTDGVLVSEPATVTLTAVTDGSNAAPAWCPVEGCQLDWTVPAVAPGGTLVYPVLDGWVDPEGDPMMLAGVDLVQPEDPARAIVTADGRLAMRHTDANASASEVALRITVRDARGEERTRELQVPVRPDAPAQFLASSALAQVGETMTLRPLERVAGGSGSYALVDAAVQGGGSGLDVSAQGASGQVDIAAKAEGTWSLALTVRDTATGVETTGRMRVTAVDGGRSLAIPPLRAFVRPLADTTVEVLSAIPGSASRSLALTSATVADGALQADVIEHARVRVSGGTDDGAPGRVGAVDLTVAEGEREGRGRMTVFQVPEAGGGAIAVPDTATVRAGSVVDVRVLDNDVSSPGERLVLHPEVTGSGAEGELAFASGNQLRYRAPEVPGTYRLGYTVYGASTPEAGDTGQVTVTVVPKGGNRDPRPADLTVRVAPGEQAEVRVPLSGMDPDGDRLRLMGVGATDDPRLIASVHANGSSLNVAATDEAEPGIFSAEYTVRDDYGGQAAGRLRVVVVAAHENGAAPIASSDYVRLVLGSDKAVNVRPLDNDIDPARGALSLVSVEPNVPGGEGSQQYRDLAARLDTSEMQRGRIAVRPGAEPGTVSYRYTVRSSASSSTSDGLIVVQTSERVGTQAPTVLDTVLGVRERADLAAGGVDVVTDKVRWSTGDPGALKLSLPGGSGDYRVQGGRILGAYDPQGDVVVFKLSGPDHAGNQVSSYGFLIIPPLDELRLTLQPGLPPIEVDENASVDTGVRDLVDVPAGDEVELRRGDLAAGRSQAACSATSAETLRYSAGRGAPWSDVCLMHVRLVGQTQWTTLPVPLNIMPREPIPALTPVTRTIAPGGSEQIDLTEMVRWQGGRVGDAGQLRFEVSGSSPSFVVGQSGSSLSVEARANAVTGTQESLTVTVRGAGEASSTLTLRVGTAPQDLPRGGTVALSCTVGSDCRTAVTGIAGEHDPFAGRSGGGLELVSVDGGSCAFGSFTRASGGEVAVSWPDSRGVGGTCTVGFTVRDAQDRVGTGTIEFEARGLPRPPGIRQTGYTETSAAFAVELGDGGAAHPAVTGVRLAGAGAASCSAAGPSTYQCTATGLTSGEQHQFTARAVNAVGESDPSSAVTAWAFRPPQTPRVSAAQQTPPADSTETGGGTVDVTVSIDSARDVSVFRIYDNGVLREEVPGGRSVSRSYSLPVGPHTLRVVAVSRHAPPVGGGSSESGAAEAVLTVAAAPRASGGVTLAAEGADGLRVNGPGWDPNFSPNSVSVVYRLGPPNGDVPPNCQAGQESPVFTGLEPGTYHVRVCATNGYGRTSVASTEPLVIEEPPPPLPEPTP